MTLGFFKSKPVQITSAIGSLVGVGCLIKDYCQGNRFSNPVSAKGKIVLITGANVGIGKETAREMAARGAKVYMACRNPTKCEEARKELIEDTLNPNIYCEQCDLSSFDSIRKFVTSFKEKESKLDILINNAGVMRCPQSLTKDGIEMQLGVNHMGHFLLTNLLVDLLKQSRPSRIVIVSSIAHTRGDIDVTDLNSEKSYDGGKAYNQSKLANILFSNELAKRLKSYGVTVNSLHPGIVDTELMRHIGIFSSFLPSLFIKPLIWPFLKTAKSGAQTSLFVALDPSLENVTGKYFADCEVREISPQAQNEDLAKWLWAVSEKWTKLNA